MAKDLTNRDRSLLNVDISIEDVEPSPVIDLQMDDPRINNDPSRPSGAEVFAGFVTQYNGIIEQAETLLQTVDKVGQEVAVTPTEEDNNALLQAVRRVFHKNTTTITYDMYRAALEMRAQLTLEDSRSYVNTSVRKLP